LLIDPKGVAKEVHGSFHIVVSRIINVGRFAVTIFFGTYPINVTFFALNDDCFGDIEKVLSGVGDSSSSSSSSN
jgi:hypothetical protein